MITRYNTTRDAHDLFLASDGVIHWRWLLAGHSHSNRYGSRARYPRPENMGRKGWLCRLQCQGVRVCGIQRRGSRIENCYLFSGNWYETQYVCSWIY
jgi:hypothetical protein